MDGLLSCPKEPSVGHLAISWISLVPVTLADHIALQHSSLSQPSLCTAEAIHAYFVNGTLPPEGTICESSVPTFANSSRSLLEVVSPLANSSKRSIATESDAALLAAMVQLGRDTSSHRRLL